MEKTTDGAGHQQWSGEVADDGSALQSSETAGGNAAALQGAEHEQQRLG